MLSKLEYIKSISKVAPRFSTRLSRWAWLGLIFMLYLVFYLCGSSQSKGSSKPSAGVWHQSHRLLSSSKSQHLQDESMSTPRYSVVDKIHGDYRMRANAPTMVYHLTTSVIHKNNSGLQRSSAMAVRNIVEARKLSHPEFSILRGELMHASLETAINSDLPGSVRAVVSRPVFAYTGGRLLIPVGSRLVGQYSSATMQGVNRIFIIWQHVALPNGTVADLNSFATDELGQAGLTADAYHTHFMSRFGQASLLSILGAGVSNLGVSTQAQYNSAAAYKMGVAQSLQQSSQQSIQQRSQKKPTLIIDQGASINVFVAHPISFYRVQQRAD